MDNVLRYVWSFLLIGNSRWVMIAKWIILFVSSDIESNEWNKDSVEIFFTTFEKKHKTAWLIQSLSTENCVHLNTFSIPAS